MMLVEPSVNLERYLELEFLAAAPYLTFVYSDEVEARAISRFLFDAAAGEGAAQFGRLAVEHGEPVAMISHLDGAQLRQARSAAATALVRAKKIDPRGPVRERMLLAADTLAPVTDADYYLSRIAVASSARGRGIAASLMAELERAAARASKTRILLEVSTAHEAACRLYARCGFHELAEMTADDPETGRRLTYRQMVKS